MAHKYTVTAHHKAHGTGSRYQFTSDTEAPALKVAEEWEADPYYADVNIEVEATLEIATTTWANGYGEWRARAVFSHPLDPQDERASHNLHHNMPTIRRAVRKQIVDALVEREQKTNETKAEARRRLTKSIKRLRVLEWDVLGDNEHIYTSITFGE